MMAHNASTRRARWCGVFGSPKSIRREAAAPDHFIECEPVHLSEASRCLPWSCAQDGARTHAYWRNPQLPAPWQIVAHDARPRQPVRGVAHCRRAARPSPYPGVVMWFLSSFGRWHKTKRAGVAKPWCAFPFQDPPVAWWSEDGEPPVELRCARCVQALAIQAQVIAKPSRTKPSPKARTARSSV